jgi:C4-type Zn-finger protein
MSVLHSKTIECPECGHHQSATLEQYFGKEVENTPYEFIRLEQVCDECGYEIQPHEWKVI